MKLVLDNFTPPSLQEKYRMGHWSKRWKGAPIIHNFVWGMCQEQKVKPIKKYPIGLEISIFIKGMKTDLDNRLSVKEIIDGLRYAGIIKNDSPKFINNLIVEVVLAEENKVVIQTI